MIPVTDVDDDSSGLTCYSCLHYQYQAGDAALQDWYDRFVKSASLYNEDCVDNVRGSVSAVTCQNGCAENYYDFQIDIPGNKYLFDRYM